MLEVLTERTVAPMIRVMRLLENVRDSAFSASLKGHHQLGIHCIFYRHGRVRCQGQSNRECISGNVIVAN